MKKLSVAVILLAIAFFAGNCDKKDQSKIIVYDFVTVTNDMMVSYLVHTDIYFRVDHILRNMNDSLQLHPGGVYRWHQATVTIDPPDTISFPKSITIDYDSSRALDSINGLIAGELSGPYSVTNSRFVYTCENYSVDGYRVYGGDTIVNNGPEGEYMTYTFEVRNSYLLKERQPGEHDSIPCELILYPRWSEMKASTRFNTGYLSGTARDKMMFRVEIHPDYPLIKDEDCEFFRDGIFNYRVLDEDSNEVGDGVFDFGYPDPMTCDKYAAVVISGDGYRIQREFIMD